MTKDEVLERLRVLARLERPVWLAGGVGADFHVGRWTRDHGDIDLVTFEEHREGLDAELAGLGFERVGDRGWITNWTCSGQDPGEVSLAYERRLDDTTGALVMLASYDGVEPGVYPGVPGPATSRSTGSGRSTTSASSSAPPRTSGRSRPRTRRSVRARAIATRSGTTSTCSRL